MTSIKTKSDFIVRLADENDTLSIINIWRECFTNDLTYIHNFLKYCFPHTKTWIALPHNSKEPVAILSVLPSYLVVDGKKIKGGYIYGVATLPEFRGNSLSSLLMNTAIECCTDLKYHYLVVKPANESLFDLYRRQSFDILINKSVFSVELSHFLRRGETTSELIAERPSKKLVDLESLANDIEKLFAIREREMGKSYLLWPESILTYSILDAQLKGGDLHFYTDFDENKCLYMIEHPDEDNVGIIKVLDCNAKDKRDVYCIISYIRALYPDSKKFVFEGSFNYNSFNKFSPVLEKSALVKLMGKKLRIEDFNGIHLSLPME